MNKSLNTARRSEKIGVVIGRFNVPSLGHAHTLERAAEEYANATAVGLIDSDLWSVVDVSDPDHLEYTQHADVQHQRITFTLDERRELLERTIDDIGLKGGL